MAEKKDGGPAFPRPLSPQDTDPFQDCSPQTGMTLRDHFAGQAIAGLAAKQDPATKWKDDAETAFEIADLMIEARDK